MCNLGQGLVEQGIAQGIEQGITQGIEIGIKQGVEQGITQGIAQGIEQGITQGNLNAITKLLVKGLSDNEIIFLLDTTPDQLALAKASLLEG